MLTVLLVDDEPGAIKALKYAIDWEIEGYRIIGEAANGDEALKRLQTDRCDLVFSDIRMPGMDGLELFQRLNEHPRIHTIAVSGYEEFEYARQCMKYGVKDYLLKPVNENDLLALIRNIRNEIERLGHRDGLNTSSTIANWTQPFNAIRELKQIVEKCYAEQISIKSIAERLHMNAAYWGQLFKTNEGISFNDYLLSLRMQKACRMLTLTDMKVYEVALAVGYKQLDWFYKKFKECYGVSANEFRNLSRGHDAS